MHTTSFECCCFVPEIEVTLEQTNIACMLHDLFTMFTYMQNKCEPFRRKVILMLLQTTTKLTFWINCMNWKNNTAIRYVHRVGKECHRYIVCGRIHDCLKKKMAQYDCFQNHPVQGKTSQLADKNNICFMKCGPQTLLWLPLYYR